MKTRNGRRNSTRAQRKKLMHQFKVGDLVTWGEGRSAWPVLEVRQDGVIVNGGPGFERLRVAWDKNARWGVHHCDAAKGPPRHAGE